MLLSLVLAGALAASGSAELRSWEWAAGDAPPPAASAWTAAEAPWARPPAGGPATLWLRTRLPAGETHEPLALLVGYQSAPFDVFVGARHVHGYAGSRREVPWHLVPLPRDAAGQVLLLRVRPAPRAPGLLGFPYGVRVGTRAEHLLWMLRTEWWPAACAVGFLALALLALVAHVVARVRGQDRPYGALAALCAATGLYDLPMRAGHLTALLVPRQDVLDLVASLAVSGMVLAGLWYLRKVYQQPLRFALPLLAFASAGYVAAHAVGTFGWELEFPHYQGVQRLLTVAVALATLANIAALWRRCSRALRTVSLGLAAYELLTVAQVAGAEVGPLALGVDLAALGFGVFLLFVVASLLVVGLEARAQEDREREQHARAHAVAQTTTMFAHDVRKPFAIMRMSLQSLRAARTMDEVRHALAVAGEEVEQVTRTVDEMIADILDAGAPAALKPQDVELQDCLALVLGRLGRVAEARDVTFSYALHHTRQLHAQRTQVERVLGNLLCNAVEAMQGRGHVWLHARDVRRRGRALVELTVGNDHASIPPAQLERVFEPFVTSGKEGGTGLGLSIVKKFVTAHGGDIHCRSTGAQVEFVLTLPASERAAASAAPLPARLGEEAAPPSPAPGPGAGGGRGHVVLVEDSRAVRLAWQRRLPEGVLRDFASPSDCLAAAAREPGLLAQALVVVLDNRFAPGEMDGLALGAQLRARTRAPLLLCSGVPLSPLPPWCDGQLPKDTYDLETLLHPVRREGA